MADPATTDATVWQIIANFVGLIVASVFVYYGRLKGKEKAEPEEVQSQDFVVGGASLLDSRPIRKELADQFAPAVALMTRMALAGERSAAALEGVLQEMAERSEEARENQRLEDAREEGRREEREGRAMAARKRARVKRALKT